MAAYKCNLLGVLNQFDNGFRRHPQCFSGGSRSRQVPPVFSRDIRDKFPTNRQSVSGWRYKVSGSARRNKVPAMKPKRVSRVSYLRFFLQVFRGICPRLTSGSPLLTFERGYSQVKTNFPDGY